MRAYLFRIAVVLLIIGASTSQAAECIAVVVANTTPYYKNRGREQDVLKILREVEEVADKTNLPLNLFCYLHEEYNSTIIEKLENIEVHPEDVLLFFYSGHGYRGKEKDPVDNPWPNLYLESEERGIDFQLITQILEEKKPRLLISIANCCNKQFSKDVLEINRTKKLKENRIYGDVSIENDMQIDHYRSLFLEYSGKIVSSSSLPGQFSYRHPKNGSFYINAFFDSLHRGLQDASDVCWESILRATVDKTIEATSHLPFGAQNPQFELQLQKYWSGG